MPRKKVKVKVFQKRSQVENSVSVYRRVKEMRDAGAFSLLLLSQVCACSQNQPFSFTKRMIVKPYLGKIHLDILKKVNAALLLVG